jgi:hypothetical protein
LQLGGSLESLFDLAILNGLGATDDVADSLKSGVVLNSKVVRFYKLTGLYPATTDNVSVNNLVIPAWVVSKPALSKKGQTLVDLALMESGTIEGAFDIMARLGLAVTSDIGMDTAIKASSSRVRRFYDNAGLYPVTWWESPEGVGYWFVDLDLIVS